MMAEAALDEGVTTDTHNAQDRPVHFDLNVLRLHPREVEFHHPAAGCTVHVGSRYEFEASADFFERVVLHEWILAKMAIRPEDGHYVFERMTVRAVMYVGWEQKS